MSNLPPIQTALDEWIARDAISFSIDSVSSVNSAIDQVIASLEPSVELLGFGEAMHGGEEFLALRNRFFQRLVEAHGYRAIAVESSFVRSNAANDWIAGRGAESYDSVRETGFSHGFGALEANRELLEWMREYNADPSHGDKLQFYGFDAPIEMYGADSPRRLIQFVVDYLGGICAAQDSPSLCARRERIDQLLGADADWENPGATFDSAKSVGQSSAAHALRIETEELISELHVRRPEWTARSDRGRFLEAAQHGSGARQLLNYHAGLARTSPTRISDLLGIRDLMMADNLNYIVARECERKSGAGKVFAFAHNSHLQRGTARWKLGSEFLSWWPAGAHLQEIFGPRYAVIGSSVGVSDANGIAAPEEGTLEHCLTADGSTARFIATHLGKQIDRAALEALPVRSGSLRNQSYFALTAQSPADFDYLVFLNSATHSRGGPPLS